MPVQVVIDAELTCLVVKETVLLVFSLVPIFCHVIGSKKCFSCPCFKRFCMNVFFRAFPNSSAWRISLSISSETGAPNARQYNFFFVRYPPRICEVWFIFHDFLYSTPTFLCLRWIMITMFTSFWTFQVIFHVTLFQHLSSKSFALEDVVQTQCWYSP